MHTCIKIPANLSTKGDIFTTNQFITPQLTLIMILKILPYMVNFQAGILLHLDWKWLFTEKHS